MNQLIKIKDSTLAALGIKPEALEAHLASQAATPVQTPAAPAPAPEPTPAPVATVTPEPAPAAQAPEPAPAPVTPEPAPAPVAATPAPVSQDDIDNLVNQAVSRRMATMVAATGVQGEPLAAQAPAQSTPEPGPVNMSGEVHNAEADAEAIWAANESIRSEFVSKESFACYLANSRKGNIQIAKRPRE